MNLISRCAAVALLALVCAVPSRAAEVDNLLPKETELIVQINVKQMLESNLIKKAIGKFTEKALTGKDAKKTMEAQKLLKDLGFDPMTDIERLTVGIWGLGKEQGEGNGIFLARGIFDSKKIQEAAENAAKESGDKVSTLKEGELELIKLTGDDGKPNYIAVIDGKLLISSQDKKVTVDAATVATSTEKPKPVLSRALSALVLKQDAKASLFACGITADKLEKLPGDFSALKVLGVDGDKIKTGLGKMSSFGLTVNFGKDVTVAIKMALKDNDSADDFAAEVGKLVSAAKTFLPLFAGDKPMLKDLMEDVSKTIDTVAKDKDVVVSVKVSADTLGKLLGPGDEEKEKDKDK